MNNNSVIVKESGNLMGDSVIVNGDRFDIRSVIYTIRGVQVMLDRDLAAAYQVTTAVFNQAVKRNADRFPSDLMFQVEASEVAAVVAKEHSDQTCSRSQFVTLNRGRGQNIKYKPCGLSARSSDAFLAAGVAALVAAFRGSDTPVASRGGARRPAESPGRISVIHPCVLSFGNNQNN